MLRLRSFDEELWTAEGGPIPFFAPPFPVRFSYALRMVVVRLSGGGIWISSPLPADDALVSEVEALGPVRHLVSPNKLHHLYLGRWAQRFPEAAIYASPGLPAKRPDLSFASTLGDRPPAAWASELDQVRVAGSVYMEEIVFFHRRSRTVILGDLIENHDPALLSPLQRALARFNRMLAPHGETPRNFRLSFTDRARAREAVRTILSWEPEHLVLMHGPCVRNDALAFLRRGLAWLRP